GYDDNEPMIDQSKNGLTGASAAAPIWALYMERALQGKNQIKFPIPEGIKFEKVDVHTGTFADNQSTETMNVAVKEETVILPRAIESIPIEQDPAESSITSELTNVPNP
ncbi:MAG TPA: peptidase, partial [Nitrospinaceae bacterium]|nr:peptidase [Nitrospinaceae bacterium]